MALESHGEGTVYYYRSRRAGRRVRKEYVAAGLHAVAASDAAEQARMERRAERDERRAALAAFEAEEAGLDDLCQRTETLVRATLLGAGYRQHDRGDWRRRR